MPKTDYLKELMEKVKAAKKKQPVEAPEKEEEAPVEEFESPKDVPAPIQQIESIPTVSEKDKISQEMEDLLKQPTPQPKAVAEPIPEPAKTVPVAVPEPTPATAPIEEPVVATRDEVQAKESVAEGVAEIPKEEPVEKKSEAEKDIEKAGKKIEVASYGDVKIYKIPGKPLLYYFIPVPRSTGAEKTIINTIKEAATRLITISPYKIREPEQRRAVYKQKIMEILRGSPELRIPERRFEFYTDAVVREMVGYGIIDPLVRDDKLEEIMVIGPKKPVYLFHRDYEMMTSNIEFYNDQEIIDLINRIAREIGRRVDISSPLLDARLPDGSRVNATIPPASVAGSTITIRKFRKQPYSVIDLINMNTLSAECAAFLWLAVEGLGVKPANVLIAGGTGSGKTTLLNVLASFVPENERIVTIEDTAELNLPLKHLIRMEARPPGLEGKGELTLDILTKNSLRMRPDRILVGEIRHDEAFSLFTAMNTGHAGSMGTVHANSAQETLIRIKSPPMSVPEVMLSGLDLILIEHRIHDKKKGTIRRLTEIAEVTGVLVGKAQTQTIFERDPVEDSIIKTNVPISYLKELQDFSGFSRKQIDAELNDRAALLNTLVKKNIHLMEDVHKEMQNYLLKKKEA